MAYRLGLLGRDLRRDLILEIECHEVDLDECQQPAWFTRPFTEAEVEAHPDGPRIRATVETAARRLATDACTAVLAEDESPSGT
jgi:hypothetical protein